MTKLEAVNDVLMRVGLYPVTELDTGGPSNAAMAERVIDSENRRIQSEDGWSFNYRRDVTLARDVDNKIPVPAGTITIDATDVNVNVLQQAGFLFDLDKKTLTFTASVQCHYTFLEAFANVPPVIREYIAASATERFNEQYGNDYRRGYLNENTLRAKQRAEMFNIDSSDTNVLATWEANKVRGQRKQYQGTSANDYN